jgi:hypothetical protein
VVSKTKQRIRSAIQLGYQDGLSGKYGQSGRYRRSQWRLWWDYRAGYKKGVNERKYGKRTKKSFVMGRGAVIALDIIVGGTLTLLIAYVIGLLK